MEFRGKKNKTHASTPLSLLALFESGSLSLHVNGQPLAALDADSRTLGVDLAGLKASGLRLSELVPRANTTTSRRDPGLLGSLLVSEQAARELAELGWNLALYERGQRVLSAGRGVSRLTGRVSVNPLKLRSLLEALS